MSNLPYQLLVFWTSGFGASRASRSVRGCLGLGGLSGVGFCVGCSPVSLCRMADNARWERQSRDVGEGYLSLHLELAQLCSQGPMGCVARRVPPVACARCCVDSCVIRVPVTKL